MRGSDVRRLVEVARFGQRRVREVYAVEGARAVVRRGRHWWRKRSVLQRAQGLPGGRVGVSATSWPPSVLAVAERSIPQCYHYRVDQKRQILAGLGVPFDDVGLDDLEEAISRLQLAGMLIVYRLADSPALRLLLDEAHRLRVPVVYDVDDLVYRREATEANPNLHTLPAQLRSAVIAGSERYADGLRLADVNLASTAALAADMTALNGRPGLVLDNGIDEGMLALERQLRERPKPGGPITALYGSGSRAHDHDFAQAAEGLAAWLASNPGTRLHAVGPVRLPEALQQVSGQIVRTREPLEYPEYLTLLHASTIALAPLSPDHFNTFKSQVKYLESALAGTPLIASPTVYRDYVDDGRTGLLAEPSDWGTALTRLAGDRRLRERLATAAREDVRRWELPNLPTTQMRALLEAVVPAWRSA